MIKYYDNWIYIQYFEQFSRKFVKIYYSGPSSRICKKINNQIIKQLWKLEFITNANQDIKPP